VNDQLDKRARQLVLFPWLGLIASFQANNRVSDMDRFARSHFQVARQAVALVQYTDRRHTFRHRRRRAHLYGRWLWCYLRHQWRGFVQIVGNNRRAARRPVDDILNRRRSGG
jgi:hypothetical protein